jgi:hypothetical protein
VGAIAEHDSPAFPLGRRSEEIARTIAVANEPTPTSRIGPGLNGAIKPEFVAPGGNLEFRGVSNARQVYDDEGLAVMSFCNEPTRSLFDFGIGTSFAAPHVSRSAAILLQSLREQFGEEPDANLVRAVLASAAELPIPDDNRIQVRRGNDGLRQVYGYGQIDDDTLYVSADRRVTMVAQSSMPLDTFAIYEVPSPADFRTANGSKRVIVTLAFDPPTRRRRADYLGVRMNYALIRGKSVDDIVEAYRQLSQDERSAALGNPDGIQGAFKSPYKCALEPGPQTLQASTLQRSEWTFSRENNNYGDSWYLVVRAERTWAPDSITEQRFAATVTLQADEPNLYNLIRNRIQLRQQQRTRARR